MRKRDMEAEIVKLTYCVQELEERLCPCNQHDYKRVERAMVFICQEPETIYKYQCSRCGKRTTAYGWEGTP